MRSLLILALALAFAPTAMAQQTADSAKDMLVVPPAADRPLEKGDGGAPKPEPQPAPDPTEETAGAEENVDGQEAAVPAEGEDPVVPPAFPLSRYTALWEKSPFQLESIAPPTVSEGLSQRFALTGIAHIDGEPMVFVMERATQQRLMLKKAAEQGGISLVQIDMQQKYNDSTATIRQGGEVGVLKFDASGAPAGMPMPVPGGISGGPVPQPQGFNPLGVPQNVPGAPVTANAQDPFGQGAAPQPPGVVPGVPGPGIPPGGQLQQIPNPQQPGPPRVIRRRAIVPATP
jgi:hypothetical protein